MATELKVGARAFGNVRKVTIPGEKDKALDRAKAITDGNGLDEIYFKTAEGDLYVAVLRGNAKGAKTGYLGRYGDKKVEVVHVDDEANTFREGTWSIFSWTSETLGKAAGTEMTKAFGTVAGTIVGGLIAAAAVKGSTQAGAQTTAGAVLSAAGAAGSATVAAAAEAAGTTAAAASGAVARGLPGGLATGAVKTVGTVRAAFQSATSTAIKVIVPVAALGVVVFGAGSVIGGIRATRRRANYATLDMITDSF